MLRADDSVDCLKLIRLEKTDETDTQTFLTLVVAALAPAAHAGTDIYLEFKGSVTHENHVHLSSSKLPGFVP